MIKRSFRPLWSYDVVKTENWLNSMSLAGYRLIRVNFKARVFTFESFPPQPLFYRIVFQKNCRGNVPANILSSGWKVDIASKNHYIVHHDSPSPAMASPSYSGVLDKNRKLKFIIGILLLMLLLPFLLIVIFPYALIIILFEVMGWGISLAILLALIWMTYTYFKLLETNRQLEQLCGEDLNLDFTIPRDGLLSEGEEKEMLKTKRLVRRIRIAWTYEPDKIEKWLETMESKGFNLYRLSRLGNTFYFVKGTPRRMKYSIDYQNKAQGQYFAINKEAGWKLVFTSPTRLMAQTIWSHEVPQGGWEPEFYSDAELKIKQARRFAMTYSYCFIPLCLVYIFMAIHEITGWYFTGYCDYFELVIQTILIFEFGHLALRTIRYYFRVRNGSRTTKK